MGFLDQALTILGGAVTGFVAGGPAGAVAGALVGAQTPESNVAAGLGSLGTAGAALIETGSAAENIAASKQLALVQAGGGPTGFMKNITRTIVMTIAPNGTTVRQVVLKGSPYLMNSDFVILKRTLRLIGEADERVPRPRTRGQKQAKELAHTKGLLEGLVAAASPTQALLAHHAHPI